MPMPDDDRQQLTQMNRGQPLTARHEALYDWFQKRCHSVGAAGPLPLPVLLLIAWLSDGIRPIDLVDGAVDEHVPQQQSPRLAARPPRRDQDGKQFRGDWDSSDWENVPVGTPIVREVPGRPPELGLLMGIASDGKLKVKLTGTRWIRTYSPDYIRVYEETPAEEPAEEAAETASA